MSGRPDDGLERLEADLRDVLGELALAPPPLPLRLRVAAIPDRVGPVIRPWARLHRPVAAAASIVAGLLVIVALLSLRSAPAPSTGQAPISTPRGPDAIEGTGVLDDVPPLLPFVPVITGCGVAVALLAVARRRHVPAAVLAAVGLAAVGLVGLGFLMANLPPVRVSGYGPQEGLDLRADPAPGTRGPTALYVTAAPGDRFGLGLLLANPGPLPVRILGVVERNRGLVAIPKWTGVGVVLDAPPGSMLGWQDAAPFEPFEIPPGEVREIVLLGRASVCAYGPGLRREDLDTMLQIVAPEIRIAYSVLWMSAEAVIEEPVVVVQPGRLPCP